MVRSRLRVLFVPQLYPAEDGHNHALGTYCREHVRAAALYDDVAVLAFGSRPGRSPFLAWQRTDDSGVPTYYGVFGHSPIPKTNLVFFRWHLRRAILRVIQEWGRPDVIHTQDAYAYHVSRCTRDLQIPFVISQHWSGFMSGILSKSEIRQFAKAFAQAALVFPVNYYAAADYESYGIKVATTWLPNALDTSIFCPPDQLADRAPWLLHVSGFTAAKRFPDVVRAFAQARLQRPQTVLHVVGEGRSRAEMELLAKKELPPDSFCFHGYLGKTDLANFMRRACGLVLPSEFETFGCVLMEAMACECPVLTTRVGGIPAVVGEGDGLFVEVGDIDDIATKIVRLIDGTHGIEVARTSRETRKRFSHETVGRILHEGHLNAADKEQRVLQTNKLVCADVSGTANLNHD
jgi:glycosyltransferase involved in cell wall biosynthesis